MRGQKKLKAIYATVQSMFPQFFSAKWDGLFFSLWSSELSNAMTSLCDQKTESEEKTECDEILWTKAGASEPIHHIYHLSEQSKLKYPWLKPKDRKELQSTIISWNLLPTCFSISWLLLIELINASNRTLFEGVHRKLPMKYQSLLRELRKDFESLNINILPKKYFVRKDKQYEKGKVIKIYLFLPFHLSNEQRRQVFNFYNTFTRSGAIKVEVVGQNSARVIVERDKVRQSYEYLDLDNPEAEKYMNMYLDLPRNTSLPDLVDEFIERFESYIPSSTRDSKKAVEWFEEYGANIKETDKCVQQMTLEKIRYQVLLLQKYRQLIKWRYDIIIKGLERLAFSTEMGQPISFSFIPDDQYKQALVNKDITAICIEVTDEFIAKFLQQHSYYRSRYGSGTLTHIHHFFQPGDICKLVAKKKKGISLPKGLISI